MSASMAFNAVFIDGTRASAAMRKTERGLRIVSGSDAIRRVETPSIFRRKGGSFKLFLTYSITSSSLKKSMQSLAISSGISH